MDTIGTNAEEGFSTAFLDLIRRPVTFRLFLLKNLPSAYFSGLKIKSAGEDKIVVVVPYKWFTRNPFRCTYFACLSMAAEMSTGILAMANTYKRSPKVSMLVTAIEGKFYKKAIGNTEFVCGEDRLIRQSVETSVVTGQSQSIKILSSGFNDKGELIAEFWVTWSFKSK